MTTLPRSAPNTRLELSSVFMRNGGQHVVGDALSVADKCSRAR